MKLVCGVGTNDSDYRVSYYIFKDCRKHQVICPYYNRWKDMLRRCYDKNYKRNNESLFVCEEWLTFSSFKSWMEKQDWEGNHLDKDILINGNKEYSPVACSFIPKRINNLFGDISSRNKTGFIGVFEDKRNRKNPYRSQISHDRKSLGCFKTPFEAHRAWQWAKAEQIEKVVTWYATKDCFRTDVADALTRRVWQLRLDHANNQNTKEI